MPRSTLSKSIPTASHSPFSSVREFMQRTTPAGAAESPDEVPLPPAIMCHVFLLSCVLERSANRQAEQHGLTIPQWMALGCIGNEAKRGISHSDLCHRMMLSKAPVTGIVDRLVRDGYAQRIADESDRRVSRIVIKPKGEAAWRKVRDALREHAFQHCSALSQQEQEAVLNLLARLLDTVAKADPILPDGAKS